jgi:hypothetical protein
VCREFPLTQNFELKGDSANGLMKKVTILKQKFEFIYSTIHDHNKQKFILQLPVVFYYRQKKLLNNNK